MKTDKSLYYLSNSDVITFYLKFNTTQIDHDKLYSWLSEVLQIDTHVSKINSSSNKQEKFEYFMNLASKFIVYLFYTSGIPIFKEYKVSRTTLQSSTINGSLSINKLNHIQIEYYKTIIQKSLNLIPWMCQNNINHQNTNLLYQKIHREIVKPIKMKMSPGKTLIPMLQTADSMDIPYIHLGMGYYQLGWGSNSKIINKSATKSDSNFGVNMCRDKYYCSSLLRDSGLPTPIHYQASNINQAKAFAKRLQFPVVIKPHDAERGQGVTTNINDNESLQKAFVNAKRFTRQKSVLIEKEVKGVCHRLFIQKGKLLYGAKRLPRFVRGNGTDTVSQLIHKMNQKGFQLPVWNRDPNIPLDQLTIIALKKHGFTLDSIPKKDTIVPIRLIESTRWGGEVENISKVIHPENIKIAVEAAKLFNLEVAGIDIITENISIPWYESGAIINEVNYMPMLGASELSRSYIKKYIHNFIKDDGRIPLKQAKDIKEALSLQKKILKKDLRCYITSSDQTINPSGKEINFAFQNLQKRFKALIRNTQVDAIIIIQ